MGILPDVQILTAFASKGLPRFQRHAAGAARGRQRYVGHRLPPAEERNGERCGRD
jgi:hypothetical protein